MPVKKGTKKPEYTPEQRADIVERVCLLYESQNSTIESCCEACGISQAAFYLWTAQYGDIGERYKKAKAIAEDNWFENILKPKALRATEILLEQKEIEESKIEELAYQGVKTGDSRTITTKTIVQPNATTAIFAMKGAFPGKFNDKIDLGGKVTVEGQTELTPDAVKALAKILQGG